MATNLAQAAFVSILLRFLHSVSFTIGTSKFSVAVIDVSFQLIHSNSTFLARHHEPQNLLVPGEGFEPPKPRRISALQADAISHSAIPAHFVTSNKNPTVFGGLCVSDF